jgi:ferredoxin
MFKIIHDKKICIGCGACVSLCPKYWEMLGDSKAFLKGSDLNPETNNYELEVEEIGCHQESADACPVQCIIISKK